MYEISKKRLGAGMLAAGINTARELAKVSGVSVNTISRLNNGGAVKLATLRRLAAALKVDPAELLENQHQADKLRSGLAGSGDRRLCSGGAISLDRAEG